LFGLAAVVVGRKLQHSRSDFRPLSESGENFDLVFSFDESGEDVVYRCRQTPFKVWSLIGGAMEADSAGGAQTRVYHVQIRSLQQDSDSEEESLYATIHGVAQDGKLTRSGQASLGCAVELRECRVGGAVNGVETGRRIRSGGRLRRILRRGQEAAGLKDEQPMRPDN